jgi:putative transposase
LTGKGISLHNLSYNSTELHALFRRLGNDGKGFPVELRIDEGDLGHIHVIVPDKSGHVIRVPALDQNYANGTSLWMHKVFRRFAAEHSFKQDPTGWMQAQMEISAIVEQSLGRRKRKSNAKAARYIEAGNQIVRDQTAPIASSNECLSTPYPAEQFEESSCAAPAPTTRKRRVYEAIIETR